jgi:hypothetical protein
MAVIIESPDELVDAIIADLRNRKDFDGWWDSIDEDVKFTILMDLTKIVMEF